MSSEDLYDEFGNYIGPELLDDSDEDDSSNSGSEDEKDDISTDAGSAQDDLNTDEQQQQIVDYDANAPNSVVLFEDKEHYSANVYPGQVNTVTLTEDTDRIEDAIVPPKVKTYEDLTADVVYTDTGDYFTSLLQLPPQNKRFVSIVGEFHSGKTSLVDLFVEESIRRYGKALPAGKWGELSALEAVHGGGFRLMDTLEAEQQRQMSIQSSPLTLMLPDHRDKSHLITFLDTPGHIQFTDEVTCTTALSDGVLLVIDPLEPIINLPHILPKFSSQQGVVLCLNKLDRLILEVKLPPQDLYWKLVRVIEEVNAIMEDYCGVANYFSPTRNVMFGSGLHGYVFTLKSFARMYFADRQLTADDLDVEKFSVRMWGDSFYCQESRKFYKSSKKVLQGSKQRSFVEFILEPLYKLYSVALGEEQNTLDKILRNLPTPILLPKQVLRSSTKTIVRSILGSYFGSLGFVDMLLKLPSPSSGWKKKAQTLINMPVPRDDEPHPLSPDSKTAVIHVSKLLDFQGKFAALCRVYSGQIKVGQRVQILGSAYPADLEDVTFNTITAIHVPTHNSDEERVKLSYRSLEEVNAGNIVILHGVDATITQSATIIGSTPSATSNFDEDDNSEDKCVFRPLRFTPAVVKLSIEPLRPAELPKMVHGLRSVLKCYPGSHLVVHDTGEHCIYGTGEVYLDTLMQFLRQYSDVEIKVAEPTVALRESVTGTSVMGIVGETPNKRNKITITSSQLEAPITNALSLYRLPKKEEKIPGHFMQEFGWDLLSSRSIWAFDYERGSLLLDDTIPDFDDVTSKENFAVVKPSIVQGFRWASKEGPLCEEPFHGCKVKLLDAVLAPSAIHRSSGQIIPTIRRTIHASMLLANPTLLEPVNKLYITAPTNIVDSLTPLLTKRRGFMTGDSPVGASTYSVVTAYVPVMDSFGLETDVRMFSQGQAMVHSLFEYWNEVPGDPLDSSIVLHPLEPSPVQCLAREYLVKTRRRKGLNEHVSIDKYLDEEMKRQLLFVQKNDVEGGDIEMEDGEML